MGITEMRTRYGSRAHEILVPFPIELPLSNVEVNIPQRGEKRKLLELSLMNVKQYRFDRLKQAEKLNPEQKSVRLMKEIQQDLGLPHLPLQIELFDNSHIQGSDAVAACVVFERLNPARRPTANISFTTVPTTTPPCARWYSGATAVCRKRAAACPT